MRGKEWHRPDWSRHGHPPRLCGGHGAREVLRLPHFQGVHRDPQRLGGVLYRAYGAGAPPVASQRTQAGQLWDSLLGSSSRLVLELRVLERLSRDIPARPRQAGDEP